MDLNRAQLIGNITKNPELKQTASGTKVATLTVVTNYKYKDSSWQQQERAEYHNIVLWSKTAEIAAQYLSKWSKVYVEGRLQTRSWEDSQGQKKYITEIHWDQLIMLNDKKSSNTQQSNVSNDEENIDINNLPF